MSSVLSSVLNSPSDVVQPIFVVQEKYWCQMIEKFKAPVPFVVLAMATKVGLASFARRLPRNTVKTIYVHKTAVI